MIQVIKAAPTDIADIKAIETVTNLSSWSAADYLAETQKPEGLFYVAKIEKQTVGFALARLIILENNNIKFNEIEIYNIAVLSEYRRLSAATKLLQAILRVGLDKDVCKISLEVRKSNLIAQNFYRKFSFQVIGERRNFYSNPPEDAFIMSLEVKSI
jgi:ribosomal-protein-alanine N-acetyltransferase